MYMYIFFSRNQSPVPAWPFVGGSFFGGAFLLSPYLALGYYYGYYYHCCFIVIANISIITMIKRDKWGHH